MGEQVRASLKPSNITALWCPPSCATSLGAHTSRTQLEGEDGRNLFFEIASFFLHVSQIGITMIRRAKKNQAERVNE